MRIFLVALSACVCVSQPARAEILASPVIFGNPVGSVTVCYLMNHGSTAVSFLTPRIQIRSSDVVGVISDSCAGRKTLGPGAGCRLVATVQNYANASCRVNLSSKTNVRGNLESRTSTNNTRSSVELR